MTVFDKIEEILSQRHCLGYHTIGGIEIEPATDMISKDQVTLDNLLQMEGIATSYMEQLRQNNRKSVWQWKLT